MFDVHEGFSKVVEKYQKTVNDTVNYLRRYNEDEEYAKAAYAGGDRTAFSTEQEISDYFKNERATCRRDAPEVVEKFTVDLDKAIADEFRIIPDEIEKFTQVVNLSGISDDDLKRIAQDNNTNYTVLLVIASKMDSAYADMMKASLDEYREKVKRSRDALIRYVDKATYGDIDALTYWKSWCEGTIERLQNDGEKLQSLIAGEDHSYSGSMQNAMNKLAAQYARR